MSHTRSVPSIDDDSSHLQSELTCRHVIRSLHTGQQQGSRAQGPCTQGNSKGLGFRVFAHRATARDWGSGSLHTGQQQGIGAQGPCTHTVLGLGLGCVQICGRGVRGVIGECAVLQSQHRPVLLPQACATASGFRYCLRPPLLPQASATASGLRYCCEAAATAAAWLCQARSSWPT